MFMTLGNVGNVANFLWIYSWILLMGWCFLRTIPTYRQIMGIRWKLGLNHMIFAVPTYRRAISLLFDFLKGPLMYLTLLSTNLFKSTTVDAPTRLDTLNHVVPTSLKNEQSLKTRELLTNVGRGPSNWLVRVTCSHRLNSHRLMQG